ncbi:MAG: hypothetical protein Kow0069_05410 [Promethearchaeota archaeon]
MSMPMWLPDTLERFTERLDQSASEQVCEEANRRFEEYISTIVHFMHSKGTYHRYSRRILKAYRIHPNKLIDNLEQLSQLYDQVFEVDTLGTPISFLMQNLKTVLPSYALVAADGRRDLEAELPEFFAYLNTASLEIQTPGLEVYPSWLLGKWIREDRCISDVLSQEREIMLSSYSALFLENAARVLGLDVPKRVVLGLVRGPEVQLERINVTFGDLVNVEVKFWKMILRAILSKDERYLKGTKIKRIQNVEEMDFGRALKYLDVPPAAFERFENATGIAAHEFYVAEVCATIIDNVNYVVEHGFAPEEREALAALLKDPALLART